MRLQWKKKGRASSTANPAVPSPTAHESPKLTDPPEISRGVYIGKMQGGTGGRGGRAADSPIQPGIGGSGGRGGIAGIEYSSEHSRLRVDEQIGGDGGEGGEGATAGDGGDAGDATVTEKEDTLLSTSRPPGPEMGIEAFGTTYANSFSKVLVDKLTEEGYDTPGSLRYTTTGALEKLGFKPGHIGLLKHALDRWSPKT